jgi:hypothetical protein
MKRLEAAHVEFLRPTGGVTLRDETRMKIIAHSPEKRI